MATHNWPGFGLASVSCSLDRPATVNRSSYTGVRSVATNPWHGKWSFKVQLATMQGDGAFQAARAFFTSLKGQVDNFHLPAVEAPQNANTGVTVEIPGAAGVVSLQVTATTLAALVVGNMMTVNGQLLSLTAVGAVTISAGAGHQTVTFEPPLRAAAAFGTAVETAKPYALVALSSSDFTWDIGQWRRYGLSFDCEEAIGDSDGASSSGDVWNATFTSTGGVVPAATINLTVKDEGTALGSTFSTLNFVGAAVAATDVGGGQADITVTGAGVGVADRTHLAAVASPTDGTMSYLEEAGRTGWFRWTTGNFASQCTADTYQGIYVAHATIATTVGAWIRQYNGPVYATWFGFVVGAANAARLESIQALLGARGGEIVIGSGSFTMDRAVQVSGGRFTIRGSGEGHSVDSSSGTLLVFPAGSTGFRIQQTAQNSRIEDMTIISASLLTTSQLGSYTAAGTTITLNAAGDFVNGQVVQLDGAGYDVAMAGRLFTTTAGSAVVTWTDKDGIFRGNSMGYIGMEIAIAGAGFAAGTTLVSWGSGTATLSGNAASSVSNALATLTTPIITEIVSGGGTTTLTIADVPATNKTVTNRKIGHAAPGIYSTIQCHGRNLEAFESQIGLCLHGITTGANVADNCTFHNCRFGGGGMKFGVSLQGADSQVNCFFGCNFAGPEISVLDQSFLGNYFFGCHWAFNMGLLVAATGANTQLIGGYFESGTAWIVPNTGSVFFYGTESMVPGYGLNGFGLNGSTFTGGRADFFGPISAKEGGTGLNYGGSFVDGFWASGSRFSLFTGNMNNVPGVGTSSGIGLGNSLGGTGGINVLASYDNPAAGTVREMAIQASQFRWGSSFLGSQFATLTTSGWLMAVPLGYLTGAGGTVTQATSRTTGVTLNKVCGQITLFSAAGSVTWQTFTVTNSTVAATDVIRLNQTSGTDKYMLHVTHVAAGSFDVTFATTGGTTTEQPVFNFAVIKAVAA